MFKKTLLSVASAAALLGAVAAPAIAGTSVYLVVLVPAAAKAPVEAITVSLTGGALPGWKHAAAWLRDNGADKTF